MTEEEIQDLSRYLEIRFNDPDDPMQLHISVFHWFAKLHSVVPVMATVRSYLAAYDRAEYQKELDEKEARVAELKTLLGR